MTKMLLQKMLLAHPWLISLLSIVCFCLIYRLNLFNRLLQQLYSLHMDGIRMGHFHILKWEEIIFPVPRGKWLTEYEVIIFPWGDVEMPHSYSIHLVQLLVWPFYRGCFGFWVSIKHKGDPKKFFMS